MNKFETKYLPYFPIIGLGLYIIVYTFAVSAYPGGSINYPNANGYSFFHNLLCDAMDPITQSGSINGARFMAIISHIILSLTMISFFYILPKIFPVKNRNTKLIAYFRREVAANKCTLLLPCRSDLDHFASIIGNADKFQQTLSRPRDGPSTQPPPHLRLRRGR